jgi:hypothetical protein
MPGPPENVEPNALWLALTAVPRPHRVVDLPRVFPGTGKSVGQVAIWPLTQEEQMICTAEADRFVKQVMKEAQKKDEENLGYRHMFSNENAVQILFRACRDASNPPESLKLNAFPSTKGMRHELTADEISTLFEMYITVQLEVGPIVAYQTADEMEAWIRRIEEGGSTLPFDLLAPLAQKRLLTFMASQLVSFWTATSSAGSPPDDGEVDPSEPPLEGDPLTVP